MENNETAIYIPTGCGNGLSIHLDIRCRMQSLSSHNAVQTNWWNEPMHIFSQQYLKIVGSLGYCHRFGMTSDTARIQRDVKWRLNVACGDLNVAKRCQLHLLLMLLCWGTSNNSLSDGLDCFLTLCCENSAYSVDINHLHSLLHLCCSVISATSSNNSTLRQRLAIFERGTLLDFRASSHHFRPKPYSRNYIVVYLHFHSLWRIWLLPCGCLFLFHLLLTK